MSIHDSVVEMIADIADDEWEDVYADNLPDYGDPAERRGHIPDVVAASDGNKLLVEVETDKSDGKDQRDAFKSIARGSDDRRYLGVLAEDHDDWEIFERVDWDE